MEKKIFFPMTLNLQLFAEGAGGGDGGTGSEGATGATVTAAGSQTKGVKANPLANVVYGKQTEDTIEETSPVAEVNPNPTEDRKAKFEALIKGEYKDLYDARMQETIQKRFKSSKETEDKYNALTPTLEILAKKYGVDASDVKALNKAIEEDDSYFEEEALEKGISVEQLKEIRKIERENSELKKQVEEKERRENANKTYAKWMEQAEKTKAVYPSFDFRTEMQNPEFTNLVQNNVDVRTAYEVVHKDDIISGAMQFTAKQVEQKLTNKIIAGGARPAENGNSSQSATVVKSDVSQLSRADRQEIIRRVQRGEKIRF
jgi:hypothetical protein